MRYKNILLLVCLLMACSDDVQAPSEESFEVTPIQVSLVE